MARHHHQEQRQQQRAGWCGRLPLLLRWLVIPMASSLAFAVHLPPRDAAAGGVFSSSRRIGGLMGEGAGSRTMHPSSFLLPQGRAVGVGLQARREQVGGEEEQGEWHQRRKQVYGWWLREGGLGLVRGGGGGDGGGIIGGGGGGGGGGSGGSGDGSSGQGRSNGGAIVFVAALGTFKSLWGQYAELLENQPVVTKAITAGLIALVGDVCAQLFEHKLTCRRLGKEGDEAPPLKIDLLRCLAVTIEGIAITGPGLHYLYSTLERLVPAQKGALAAITHVAVDEFIFDPLFVLGFFFLCGAIEGKDLRQEIVPQVRREYWPALKGGWMVSLLFLPLEFATFRCLPLKMRVLVVNLTDVVWTAVVSYFSHLEDHWGAKGKAH